MVTNKLTILIVFLVLFLAGFSQSNVFASGLEPPRIVAQTEATRTPRPTRTPQATPSSSEDSGVPEDAVIIRIAVASANLRSGPGLAFDKVGVILFNDAFIVQDVDETGLWYQITTQDGLDGWVAKSVTEEVSPEVYEALVATPEPEEEEPEPTATPEAEEEDEAEAEAEPEPTAEPEEEAATLNVRVVYSSINVRSGPGLSYDVLGFAFRDDVYQIQRESSLGWFLIELEDGTEGWIAGSVVDLTTDAPYIAPRPIPSSSGSGSGSSPSGDAGGDADSSSETAATRIVRDGDRVRPGSSLVFDVNDTGFGAGIAIAPSGPDPRVLNGLPSKVDTSGGHQPSADYLPGQPSILLLGDGVTSGTKPIANGYRRFLYRMLTSNGYFFDYVGSQNIYTNPTDFDTNHEGHVNYRADQLLAGLSRWVGYDAPEVVLLHVGTNDILQGEGVASTVQDLRLIILTLRYFNPNVKVMISQLPPTTDPVVNAEIQALNIGINTISWTMNTGNSPVFIVDQYTGFDADRMTYDGIHPNSLGAERIARNFQNALVRYRLVSK